MQAIPVKILATGKYLPKNKVTAEQLAERVGIDEVWIEKRSGVLVRHFVENETASEMGALAAREALKTAGLSWSEIDCLVCTSSVPEQAIPCTASLIQEKLGALDSGIPAFDINSTCLSFITGLDMVSYAIAAGRYQTVLLVATEVSNPGLNWQEKQVCTIFGDGAAAAIVGRSQENESSKILGSLMETYSKGAHLSECLGAGNKYHIREYAADPEYFLFRMDGKALYRLSAEILPGFVERLLQLSGLTMEDIQLVIPHQVSIEWLGLTRKQLGIPEQKWMTIARDHGNTLAASVPMALYEAIKQDKIKRGDRLLLLGTSAGFSVGGIVLEY